MRGELLKGAFLWTLITAVAASIMMMASTEWQLSKDRGPPGRLVIRASIKTEGAQESKLLEAAALQERCKGIFDMSAAPSKQSFTRAQPRSSTWRAWVINLDSAHERLEHFFAQVADSGIPTGELPVLRFAASNTSLLPLPSLLSAGALAELEQLRRRGYRTAHYQLTPGSVGCYVSHARAWQALLDSGAEAALIFEDDATLSPEFWSQFAGDRAPADWDIVLFSSKCLCCSQEWVPGTHYRKVKRFWGTQAYAITARGAQRLMERGLYPLSQQIDTLISVMAAEGGLEVYFRDGKLAGRGKCMGNSQSKVEGGNVWMLPPHDP